MMKYDKRGFREDEPNYCGVYWIIPTLLSGLAIGAALGVLLWLVLA